jgi:MFS family permease
MKQQLSFRALQARFYIYALFDDLMPIYPLYAVMFTDNGLNPAQISSLLFVWSLTAFLLEIPSGTVADRLPRKHVLIGAQVARGLGYLSWLLFPGYWGFFVGFVLWGVESAFSSGTKQALLYDELKALDQEKHYTKISGRYTSMSVLAVGAASFVAAWLAPHGYGLLIGLSLVSIFVAILIMASMPKACIAEDAEEFETLGHIRNGLNELRTNSRALKIVLFASFALGIGALDEYHSLFFHEVGLNNQAISVWLGAITLTGIVAGLLAYRLERVHWLQRSRGVALTVAAWGVMLVAASFGGNLWAPILIMVFTFVFYLIETLTNGWLQHAIQGKSRATVTSMQGFTTELFALSGFVLVGYVSQAVSYAMAFRVCGLLTVAVGLGYVLRRKLLQ